MSTTLDTDVIVVGGGLVGSALAHALRRIRVRTALVEARDPAVLEQPSFDGRVTALANGSQRILDRLGLWEDVAADAQPIRTILISEQRRFGVARIEAREEGVAALGHTLENRSLGAALWDRLARADADFDLLAPARLARLEAEPGAVLAEVEQGDTRLRVRGRLLVAADGTQSAVRGALGISAREDDYGQQAVIVNCTTEAAHEGRAFERFTPRGPLAVLPLTRRRVGIVWTQPAAEAARAMALDDAAFRDALQLLFGRRLGRFERIGARAVHRLARVRSDSLAGRRVLLIGNAAVSLHPVAGQGFNLALRDVAALAELIADAPDPGAADLLERYARWRAADQRNVAAFTHGLVRLFGVDSAVLGAARGLGLLGFDLFPGAKSLLARHTMGMAGRLPRLARGLDLG
jgi:2-octaprenyl-6-methoxyphenol hydroxylase